MPIRTVSFRSVLNGIAIAMGLEPGVNFQKNHAAAFTEYINSRLARAVEKFWFPELEEVEQCAFRPAYDPVRTYAPGSEVYDPETDKYYLAVTASTGAPLDDASSWRAVAVAAWLDMATACTWPIHQIRTICARDPRESKEPGAMDYILSKGRVYIRPGTNHATKVWITYQTTPAQFSFENYNGALIYSAGEVVYDTTRGQCYRSRADENQGHAVTEESWWTKVEFPWVLSFYVKKAVYADALREDGQNEKATREDDNAQGAFEDACETVTLNQGQARRLGVAVRN